MRRSARALARALGSLDDLVIKPAFGDRRGEPIVPCASCDRDQRPRSWSACKRAPGDFVAERGPACRRCPCSRGGRSSRAALAWRALPLSRRRRLRRHAGRARTHQRSPGRRIFGHRERRCQQGRVGPSAAVSAAALLPSMPDRRVELRRGGLDLPSRLLDDIYWLGRYVERCDCTARLARAGFERAAFGGRAPMLPSRSPRSSMPFTGWGSLPAPRQASPSIVPTIPSCLPPRTSCSAFYSITLPPTICAAILKNLHRLTLACGAACLATPGTCYAG